MFYSQWKRFLNKFYHSRLLFNNVLPFIYLYIYKYKEKENKVGSEKVTRAIRPLLIYIKMSRFRFHFKTTNPIQLQGSCRGKK